MQSKFEKFHELPADIKRETAHHLSNHDLVKLAQTSTYHWTLFKPMLAVRQLLHHVTRGKHYVVKAMLHKDKSLIIKRGTVMDCSGREFENISGFEYALWALDKHLWTAMIACIPQNEEGRKVFATLLTQYNKVKTDGVVYILNGKKIIEHHFDFENTIIKQLQTHVDSTNVPEWEANYDVIDKQWQAGVGGAQKLLPMHVVDEYCSDKPFYPVPKFASPPKSAKQFYYWKTRKPENWFSVDSKLGVEFAIYKQRGRGEGARATCGLRRACGYSVVERDLNTLTALFEIRTRDFIDLKPQLEDQMKPDNHPQVSQI